MKGEHKSPEAAAKCFEQFHPNGMKVNAGSVVLGVLPVVKPRAQDKRIRILGTMLDGGFAEHEETFEDALDPLELVERHVDTGIPVGSKNIVGREGLDFASSTVRSELARLESAEQQMHFFADFSKARQVEMLRSVLDTRPVTATHFPSGDTTGSATRLSDIRS